MSASNSHLIALPLEDFGKMQERYQALALKERAEAVLKDAEPALEMAESIVDSLPSVHAFKKAIETIRTNPQLSGKMRPSEAKNCLMDKEDFVNATRQKLAAWRKTVSRLAAGEGIVANEKHEYIAINDPIAPAVRALPNIGAFLSVIQLVFDELAKSNPGNAGMHLSNLARIRRCATMLADCDNAAMFSQLVA